MTEIRVDVGDNVTAALSEMLEAWLTLKRLEAAVKVHGTVMLEYHEGSHWGYAASVDCAWAAQTGGAFSFADAAASLVRAEPPQNPAFRRGHKWELPIGDGGLTDAASLEEWLGGWYRVERNPEPAR